MKPYSVKRIRLPNGSWRITVTGLDDEDEARTVAKLLSRNRACSFASSSDGGPPVFVFIIERESK